MIIISQGDWVQPFEWGRNQPNQPTTHEILIKIKQYRPIEPNNYLIKLNNFI